MSQEAINIIGAGTDTTAHALMILMYYLAIDAVRYEKLREELRGVGLEMREDGGENGGFKKLELGMVERLVYLVSILEIIDEGCIGLTRALECLCP